VVAAAGWLLASHWFGLVAQHICSQCALGVLFQAQCALRCAIDLSQNIIIGLGKNKEIQALVCLNLGLRRLVATECKYFLYAGVF
jgi:hypothetical protein